MRKRKLFFIIPAAILGIVLFAALGGEVVRLLWNWLAPALFGWHAITFWQAVGLLALCRILFGGLGVRGRPRSNFRRRIRERMEEKWERMSPEERERARERWRGWCGPMESPGTKMPG